MTQTGCEQFPNVTVCKQMFRDPWDSRNKGKLAASTAETWRFYPRTGHANCIQAVSFKSQLILHTAAGNLTITPILTFKLGLVGLSYNGAREWVHFTCNHSQCLSNQAVKKTCITVEAASFKKGT